MEMNPGLCGTCQHAKRTETRRGSVFYRCQRASVDASLPKYPPLPVRHCHAYCPEEESETEEDTSPLAPIL